MRERHAIAGSPRGSTMRRQRKSRVCKTTPNQSDGKSEFQSTAFLNSLVQSSPDCIKVLDGEGNLLSINPNGCRLLEIDDPAVVLNKSWLRLWPKEAQPRVRVALDAALAGKQGRFQAIGATCKGTNRCWDTIISKLPTRRGKPTRLIAISRDITEQENDKEVARVHQQLLESLFEHVGTGIALIRGSDLRYQLINPAYQRMIPERKIVGRTISEVWPEAEPVFPNLCQQVLQTGIPFQAVDAPFLVRDPSGKTSLQRYFTVNLSRVRVPKQEGWSLLLTVWETTKRKLAEDGLLEARNELEHTVTERTAELKASNEQMEAFVYSIAHDLRAPLRAITGFAALLQERHFHTMEHEGRKMIEQMAYSANFMDRLLVDLLKYARSSAGKIELSDVSLKTAWNIALFECTEQIQQTGAIIEQEKPLPTVRADRALLGQCLANLLSNALKFVRDGEAPRIRFRTEERGDTVRIWVEDEGIGIPHEHRKRLYHVFERLHGARFAGTGIGLAIVKNGVDRMGGTLGVESEPGKGARFWIELPRATQRHKEASLSE